MKIVLIDGQGGRLGKAFCEGFKSRFPGRELTAVGTNATATAAMLRAGADSGATGENPVLVACRTADVIIGPIGIVLADALLGEVTPAMAAAAGASAAHKILIPMNRCAVTVAGTRDLGLSELIAAALDELEKLLS